jgi:hypothetical protein
MSRLFRVSWSREKLGPDVHLVHRGTLAIACLIAIAAVVVIEMMVSRVSDRAGLIVAGAFALLTACWFIWLVKQYLQLPNNSPEAITKLSRAFRRYQQFNTGVTLVTLVLMHLYRHL